MCSMYSIHLCSTVWVGFFISIYTFWDPSIFHIYSSFWLSWCWGWDITGKLGPHHSCWWHGSSYHQAICSHGTDCIRYISPCLPWQRISTICHIPAWRNVIKWKRYTYFLRKISTRFFNFVQVMPIQLYASVNWLIPVSNNVLVSIQHQATTSSNTDLSLIRSDRTMFNQQSFKSKVFSLKGFLLNVCDLKTILPKILILTLCFFSQICNQGDRGSLKNRTLCNYLVGKSNLKRTCHNRLVWKHWHGVLFAPIYWFMVGKGYVFSDLTLLLVYAWNEGGDFLGWGFISIA